MVRSRRPAAAIFAATAALLLALGACFAGCGDEYDFQRADVERGTLGEELFAIWRKDAARAVEHSDQKVELLDRRRGRFVTSVDEIAPPGEVRSVDLFLRELNRPVRTGVFPSFSRKVAAALREASEDDPMLAAFGARRPPPIDTYLPNDADDNLLGDLVAAPELRGHVMAVNAPLLAADGYDDEGRRVDGESRAFLQLQRGLADALADGRSGRESAALDYQRLLFDVDARYSSDRQSEPVPIVRFDRRGYPRVRRGSNERWFPFRDADDDGRADVDDQGRFVLQGQSNQSVRPFGEGAGQTFGRDDAGRATARGDPVFEYVDLRETALPFLLGRTAALVENGTLWRAVRGSEAVFGERIEQSDERGTYAGYREDGPAVDAVDASLEALGPSQSPEMARELGRLLDGHPGAVARLADALDRVGDAYDEHPGAELADPHTLGYDLIGIVEEVSSDPDLWSSLLESFRDPVVVRSGEAMLQMIRHADRSAEPPRGGAYDRCFQQCQSEAESKSTPEHPHGVGLISRYECIRNCPSSEVFSEKTDLGAEDRPANRSSFQRFLHLIRDATDVPYEIEATRLEVAGVDLPEPPPVIAFDDAARAFIRSVAGNLQIENHVPDAFWRDSTTGRLLRALGVEQGNVAELLSALSGLFGAEIRPEPRPGEITRLMNEDDLRLDRPGLTIDASDPVCRDGYVMAEHHADTLYAAEASGLIDAVQPIARAFSAHDRETLFGELLAIIHRHYSVHEQLYKRKDGSPSPMDGTGISTFEPAFDRIFAQNDLFRAFHEIALAVEEVDSAGRIAFEERLRRVVHRATESSPRVEGPDGTGRVTLPGGEVVSTPSRMHFVLRALGEWRDQMSRHPEAREQFQAALADLYSLFFSVDRGSDAVSFEHPGAVALGAASLDWAADELGSLRRDGELTERMTRQWPDSLGETLSSRATAGGLELGELFAENPETRRAVDALLERTVRDRRARLRTARWVYRRLVASAGSGDADAAPFLASVIDPERSWETEGRSELPFLSHAVLLVQRILELDDDERGIALLRRSTAADVAGGTPVGTLSGLVADYFRVDPSSERPRDAADWARIWSKLAVWLTDDVHGLEQIFDLVELARRDEPAPVSDRDESG